jgi:uncharacterized protein with HEPN domain
VIVKKSLNTDKQCVEKILKYIQNIRQALDHESVKSYESLEDTISAKFAVTQLITNIYELSKHMQETSLSSLKEFGKIRLRTTRQIASHDYASIDFKLVYTICLKLIAKSVSDELSEFTKEDEDGDSKQDGQ